MCSRRFRFYSSLVDHVDNNVVYKMSQESRTDPLARELMASFRLDSNPAVIRHAVLRL